MKQPYKSLGFIALIALVIIGVAALLYHIPGRTSEEDAAEPVGVTSEVDSVKSTTPHSIRFGDIDVRMDHATEDDLGHIYQVAYFDDYGIAHNLLLNGPSRYETDGVVQLVKNAKYPEWRIKDWFSAPIVDTIEFEWGTDTLNIGIVGKVYEVSNEMF